MNPDPDPTNVLLGNSGVAEVSKDRRIVLLGPTGGGRSSSGNTILGSDQFRPAGGFNLVSTETVSKSATVGGRQVKVMDTPGLTDKFPEQLYRKIMKSIVEASPGPHAFVIVVRISVMPTEHIKLFELLPKLFATDVCDAHKYSMVLFTHGDVLGKDQSIDDLIQDNRHVSDLVSMCGGRYCVFDNKAKGNREQVRHFLNKIDEMVTANGGGHFTSDMFGMAESFIKEERNRSGETGASALSGNGGKYVSVWKRIYLFLNIRRYEVILGLLSLIIGGAVGGIVGVKVSVKVGGLVGGIVGGTIGLTVGVKVGGLMVRRESKKND